MAKHYDVSTKTVVKSSLLSDLVFVGSLTTMDLSEKHNVTVVKDKQTGNTYSFDSKRDAENFIKGK